MPPANPSALNPLKTKYRLGRAVLLALGMASLVTGIWGGLLRVPITLPLPVSHANWISFHGPLMISGFLGTLISLERAVGLRAAWAYLVPVLTGAGMGAIAAGVPGAWPRWTLTAGSALFAVVSARLGWLQPGLSNVVMGLGAVAWMGGNLLWTLGQEIPQVVLWWLMFPLLTIVGERIELTRFQKQRPGTRPWLLTALVILGVGLGAGWVNPRAGGLLAGLGLLALAAWLARSDLAWRTIRQPGLPRYMAVCLLSGYGWLLAAALIIVFTWPQESGLLYDAALHSFFVGFVFAMIFGHAPVIFPAVLGLPVQYHWFSYVPLVALHGTLLLRLAGDLANWPSIRTWGAAGNAIAVGLFLLNMAASIVASNLRRPNAGVKPGKAKG